MIIYLYYTKFTEQLPYELFSYYTNILPPDLRLRNFGFIKWQDKHSNLFGKLLLMQGMKDLGIQTLSLSDLYYDEYNRPYLNPYVDFNISHSGEYVLCAIGKNVKLGIDIEKIRVLNLRYFSNVMTESQWYDINHSKNPLCSFFHYWTIKESFIKADGRGLTIPLLDININNNIALYDNKSFLLNKLNIDKEYSAHLATNFSVTNILYKFVNFYPQS